MYNSGLNENYKVLIININKLLTIMMLFITYLNQNGEGPKSQIPERLGMAHFEKEGIYKTHPESLESFLHFLSHTWAD